MSQLAPERTFLSMTLYERPEPDTDRPTSRLSIQNTNNCSHCGSGIDKSDKTCTHCGAPNENYKHEENSELKEDKVLERIKNLENLMCIRIEQNLDVKDINQELNVLNKLYKETEVCGGTNNQVLFIYNHKGNNEK